MSIEHLLLAVSLVLLLSVFGSKVSGRVGVPALLLFLVLGMLAGSDGPGGIEFDDPRLAQSLGVVALTFILFAGGFDTHWDSVRPVLWPALALATLGVALTAVLVGWFATAVLGFAWLEGLLLGAIVSSTDAAAIFAVLRSKSIALTGRLKPLLELESGNNDPMAIFLTMGFTRLLADPSADMVDLVPMFVLQMALGAALGYGMGRGMVAPRERGAAGIRGLVSGVDHRPGAAELRRVGRGGRQRLSGGLPRRPGHGPPHHPPQEEPAAVP